MNALLEALYDKSQEASNYYDAISGQQFNAKRPDCAVAPYVIVNSLSGTHDFYFDYQDTDKFESFFVQFTIVSDSQSSSEIGTVRDYLTALFDDATLTVTGYTFLSIIRQSEIGPSWDEEDRLWTYAIRYIINLRKA